MTAPTPDTAAERAREILRDAENHFVAAQRLIPDNSSATYERHQLIAAALRAAEAGARRATLLECARWHDARYVALRDNGPKGEDGLVTDIVGGHMAAHYESAEHFRASSPAAASPWREIDENTPRHGNYARVYVEEGLLYCPNGGEATHWMPLPSPPASEGTK